VKQKLLIVLAVFLQISPAFAAGTSKARVAKPIVTPTSIHDRKEKIAADIIQAFPDGYGEKIVDDPRFLFEPRIVARYTRRATPSPVPNPAQPKIPRHGFDYVINTWSKEHGLDYLAEYGPVFAEAETQFPPVTKDVPTGILDAETQFGVKLAANTYPIVKTLLALAAYYPDAKFHPEDQLIAFLSICKKNGWDAYERLGTRTGAFGLPQFEPLSYEKLAMYWDGTACQPWQMSPVPVDLTNHRDTICSIFNYLHADGFGGTEAHQGKILLLYNRDVCYCDAILDAADFFAGRPDQHHYSHVRCAGSRPHKRKLSQTTTLHRAALK
jgi:membrane-bound lytic murein transglycosylase B